MTTISGMFASVLLHLVMIVVFINIFFFTYGEMIEENVVKQQLVSIVKAITNDTNILFPEIKPLVTNKLNSINIPNLEKEDEEVKNKNHDLFTLSLILTIIFGVIGLVIFIVLVMHYKLDYKMIIMDSCASLVGIALLYFGFTTFIIGEYKSVNDAFIKKSVLESI